MTTFSELALSPSLKERLTTASFVTPTPVQAAAIPHALEGKDVIATAQTGTGKTLAFLIPIVEKLAAQKATGVSALILVPTRELAMQVVAQYDVLRSKQAPPAALVVGGLAEGKQLDALRRGARLVVATPGRLEDFLDRRLVSLAGVQTLVLDEADRMLDMGFLPSIRRIASLLPATRQTLCFSATMGAAIAQLVKDYTRNPVRLSFGSTLKPSESVRLQAFEVNDGEKADVLFQLLTSEKGRCLVFSRTKRGTDRIARVLNRQGIQAAVIHGDRSQSQRTAALTGFQRGQYRVLVATDVAARGIHVQDIAHVINYDLPDEAENFVHRVGRTGRAGESGVASTLFLRDQRTELFQLERTLGIRIERVSANLGSPASPRTTDSPRTEDAARTQSSSRSHDSARSHDSVRSQEKRARHASSFAELRAPAAGSRPDGRMARLPGEFLQVQVG
jgi:ATP-dependent RNA helicase RhlE